MYVCRLDIPTRKGYLCSSFRCPSHGTQICRSRYHYVSVIRFISRIVFLECLLNDSSSKPWHTKQTIKNGKLWLFWLRCQLCLKPYHVFDFWPYIWDTELCQSQQSLPPSRLFSSIVLPDSQRRARSVIPFGLPRMLRSRAEMQSSRLICVWHVRGLGQPGTLPSLPESLHDTRDS